MANRLEGENSPYLLQHKNNPVDWYPWGEEALQRARKEEKPIFLSIGYAACHWCHVMAHESFENPETAVMMNEHFINIKVDREERPDLDTIYMNAVVALTGQGGWPMSVFLTPDLKPFYGGTYFPPVRGFNLPSFQDVLQSIARAWEQDRDKIESAGAQLAQRLNVELNPQPPQNPFNKGLLEQAAMALAQGYDWQHGGWGPAPKFPQPMSLQFLLRRANQGDQLAMDITNHALKTMAAGGMYDVVGGGFHRYSVDQDWLVPHFEKMLYDNAQLSLAYLYGYLVTGNVTYREICEATLDFVMREMWDPEGGFYSSLDADSEGEEGLYYVRTPEEIERIVGSAEDYSPLAAAFTVSIEGNFEGRNILRRKADGQELAAAFGGSPAEIENRIRTVLQKLLTARANRVRPATDNKVLTSWNGLMMLSFAEAGRYLQKPDYVDVAMRNAGFLTENLLQADRLLRSWRAGKASLNAYLEDYAALALGLLALYQASFENHWFNQARLLALDMIAHFWDGDHGFFDTRDDHEQLLVRPRDTQDNATPSGSSLASMALLQLAALNGDLQWRDLAENTLGSHQNLASRYPAAFGYWLCAMDFAAGPTSEVAILSTPSDPQRESFTRALWSRFRPHTIAAVSTYPPPPEAPLLLEDRPLLNDLATAYVCQNFTCQRPVNTAEEMLQQLDQISIPSQDS